MSAPQAHFHTAPEIGSEYATKFHHVFRQGFAAEHMGHASKRVPSSERRIRPFNVYIHPGHKAFSGDDLHFRTLNADKFKGRDIYSPHQRRQVAIRLNNEIRIHGDSTALAKHLRAVLDAWDNKNRKVQHRISMKHHKH